jgi:hypothetical protein
MTQYPLYRRMSGPQGQYGWVWKISPSLGFNPWTIQPIALMGNMPSLTGLFVTGRCSHATFSVSALLCGQTLCPCEHTFLYSAMSPPIYRFPKNLALFSWHSHTPDCPFVKILCHVSHIKGRQTGCLAGYLVKMDLHGNKVAEASVKEAALYQRKL